MFPDVFVCPRGAGGLCMMSLPVWGIYVKGVSVRRPTSIETPRDRDLLSGQRPLPGYWRGLHTCYHPQTKFAKVMFFQVSVCSLGGCLLQGMFAPGVPAPGGECLLPGGSSPWYIDHSLIVTRVVTRPPPHDGYCCGRYASYWNAYLY